MIFFQDNPKRNLRIKKEITYNNEKYYKVHFYFSIFHLIVTNPFKISYKSKTFYMIMLIWLVCS